MGYVLLQQLPEVVGAVENKAAVKNAKDRRRMKEERGVNVLGKVLICIHVRSAQFISMIEMVKEAVHQNSFLICPSGHQVRLSFHHMRYSFLNFNSVAPLCVTTRDIVDDLPVMCGIGWRCRGVNCVEKCGRG